MAAFDGKAFAAALTRSAAFTPAQVDALAAALQASMEQAVVPGESHEAAPLRGAGADLS